jgi:hypothetical protein
MTVRLLGPLFAAGAALIPGVALAQSELVPGKWHLSLWTSATFAMAPHKAVLMSSSSAVGAQNTIVTTTFWKVMDREIIQCVDVVELSRNEAVPVGRCFITLMGK